MFDFTPIIQTGLWLVVVIITYVLQWLSERKISVDEEQIDALIEAAVYELQNAALTIETEGSV